MSNVPIVEEIGVEFRARARDAVARREAERSGPEPARRRIASRPTPSPVRRHGSRVARRVALVGAMVVLVAGVAFATLRTGDDGPPVNTNPTLIARDAGWAISGFRHEGRICIELRAGGAVSEDCSPAVGSLRVTSALADGRRLVAGVAGPSVRSVDVALAQSERERATRPAIDPATAIKAGLPAGTRWFIAVFPAPSRAPARVDGLGAHGDRVGPAVIDCSLQATAPICRRAARGAARSALR